SLPTCWPRHRSSPTASRPGTARPCRRWSTSIPGTADPVGGAGPPTKPIGRWARAATTAWTGRSSRPTARSLAGVGSPAVPALPGRLDADPVNAPRPANPRDPRSAGAAMLPHNSGEQYDFGGKITIPFGAQTLRILGLHSTEQRLLYDPAYKYDPSLAPA